MESRNGLADSYRAIQARGTAERAAALALLKAKRKQTGWRITAGADKGYDAWEYVSTLRKAEVTTHAAQSNSIIQTGKQRASAIDARSTRPTGKAMPQTRRKAIECIFGSGKQHGTMRKTKLAVVSRVSCDFYAEPDRLQSGPHPKTHRGMSTDAPRRARGRAKQRAGDDKSARDGQPKAEIKGKTVSFYGFQQTDSAL